MEDITLLSLTSLCFGFFIILCKMIYKSKCSECSFLGFNIKRDTKLETEEHKYDIEHNIKSDELDTLKKSIK